MIAQSSEIFNTEYFDSLAAKINKVNSCDQLQSVSVDVLGSLNALQAGITAQLAALQPILALLSPPGNIQDVITWISNFITGFLKPYTLPSVNYSIQLTQLSAAITKILAAIHSKQAQFPSCNLTLPSVKIT